MLFCGFRDDLPSQQQGHYLVPEKKKYAQMLRILYSVTEMYPFHLKLGFMDEDLENNREATQWFVLTEPDITVAEFMYGVGSALKNLSDREIAVSYTTLLFALQSNRPDISYSIETLNIAESEYTSRVILVWWLKP